MKKQLGLKNSARSQMSPIISKKKKLKQKQLRSKDGRE